MNEDNVSVNRDKESPINQKPLLTHEQRESFVLSFIEAYGTHQVWVEFSKNIHRTKSPDSLIDLFMISSTTSIPSEKIVNARIKFKDDLENKIKIASGSIDAPPEIIYKTINDLYNIIIELQGVGFLRGEFLTNKMENRIFDLVMARVDKHVNKVREELGLNDV